MSQPVAVLRAPIPYDLRYSECQQKIFSSPSRQEMDFRSLFGQDIVLEYLDHINVLLKKIADECDQASQSTARTGGCVDVVSVEIYIEPDCLSLKCINVRPCFEGHGMLALFVYQLVKAARKNQIPCVRVCECCEKTVDVLRYLLAAHVTVISRAGKYPTCEIDNLWEISADSLGLSGKAICTGDAIRLKPSAFPTAAQLNDRAYVSFHFRAKYGARSMWHANDLGDHMAALAVETEFQRTVGHEPGPRYIESINHMLVAFGRELAGKRHYETIDLKKQTDTVFMHICFLSKDGVNTIDLKRIHVRPCFRGNHIITLLIYQTIRLGLADKASRMVITCPYAGTTAMRKFGACEFENLPELFESISSESLEIGHAIADEKNTILKLEPSAFPSASVLHHRRLLLLEMQSRFNSV